MSGPTGNLARLGTTQPPPGSGNVPENIGDYGLDFENPLGNLTKKQQRNLAGDPLSKNKPKLALEKVLIPDKTENKENQKTNAIPSTEFNRTGLPPQMGNLNTSGSPQNSQESRLPASGVLGGVTDYLRTLTGLRGGKKRTKKGKKAKKTKSKKAKKSSSRRSTKKHAKKHTKKHTKKH